MKMSIIEASGRRAAKTEDSQEKVIPDRPSSPPSFKPAVATTEVTYTPAKQLEDGAPTHIVSLQASQELFAAEQAKEKVNDEEDQKRAIAADNIVHGLDFLGSITELRQQLKDIQQLKAQAAKAALKDNEEPPREGWLGKTFGAALRTAIQPRNVLDDQVSLNAYEKELALWAEYFHYSYLLREIVKTSNDWQRVLCVMASKGGVSKTPLIVYLAAVFAFATSTTNLLLEANENDGTVNNRYGLARDSQALLNDVIADHSLIADHQTALKTLGKFAQTSLWVLLSAANAAENEFSMPQFLETTKTIRPHFGNMWGDTGNGNRRASNEGMFLESDVALFPALAGNSDSWSTIITTMINLYQAGHAAKLQERSFVVINATSEDDTVEDFLEIFLKVATEAVKPRYNYKDGKDSVAPLWTADPVQLLRDLGFKYDSETEKLTGEGIFTVRNSSWIRDGNVVSVRPDDVGLGTIVDYLKILVAAFTLPTQDREIKKSEIERRIAERNDTPISTPETMFAEIVKAFNGNAEEALLQFAKQVEHAKVS